jgi:hypothetical protein
MKRQDIADYLGLTIETVSRILTSLESCAAIKMPTSHQVVLRNPSTLRIAMEDRSKPALSNGHSSKTAAQKRPDRRRHSVRTRVQQLVLPERNRAGPMQRGAKHDHGIKFTMEENS